MRIPFLAMSVCVACVAFLTYQMLGCGYKIQAADVTTLQNLAPNCAANVAILTDAGPAFAQVPPATMSQLRSTDKVCACGSRAILARAGQPEPDAGKGGCPQ